MCLVFFIAQELDFILNFFEKRLSLFLSDNNTKLKHIMTFVSLKNAIINSFSSPQNVFCDNSDSVPLDFNS